MRFTYPVPLGLTNEEYAAALDAFCALYFDAQEAGLDPVVGIETTPDGDVWWFEVDDDPAHTVGEAA